MNFIRPPIIKARLKNRSLTHTGTTENSSTHVTNERPVNPVSVTVADVTHQESNYTLDTHGFQFHTHKTGIQRDDFFKDDQIIKTIYYHECEDLLKQMFAFPFPPFILSHLSFYTTANHPALPPSPPPQNGRSQHQSLRPQSPLRPNQLALLDQQQHPIPWAPPPRPRRPILRWC